jgi:multidrug efflux pump subunit AcrA (membrane-fusion protein)
MSLATVLKVLLPAVTLAALGLAVRFWPIEVQGTHVETGLVTEEVLGIGVLESAHEIPLSFEISGRVTELAVDEGDTVALGTVLGTLDVTDAHRELDVSVATAAAASADIARAQAEVERGRGAASLASRDRVRSDALFANGDLTGAEHDSAVERDETAQAAVRSLEAALQRARSSRDVAKGGTRIREAQVADGVLVSPIAGFVVKRNVEIGQWVGAGTTAFTIVATDAMRVRAWVDETALGRLRSGSPSGSSSAPRVSELRGPGGAHRSRGGPPDARAARRRTVLDLPTQLRRRTARGRVDRGRPSRRRRERAARLVRHRMCRRRRMGSRGDPPGDARPRRAGDRRGPARAVPGEVVLAPGRPSARLVRVVEGP